MIKDVLGRGGVEGGGVVGGGMGTNPDFRNQIASGSNDPIFIKLGMVICITLWHINMQNIKLLEYACVHT